MEYNLEFLQRITLPGKDELGEEEQLEILAGCAWVEQHSLFRFDDYLETPPNVQLFLLRFREILHSGLSCGILSERMAGLSQAGLTQAFAVSHGLDNLLRQLASELLHPWYTPIEVIEAQDRYKS